LGFSRAGDRARTGDIQLGKPTVAAGGAGNHRDSGLGGGGAEAERRAETTFGEE
jgi:hypothetical protein